MSRLLRNNSCKNNLFLLPLKGKLALCVDYTPPAGADRQTGGADDRQQKEIDGAEKESEDGEAGGFRKEKRLASRLILTYTIYFIFGFGSKFSHVILFDAENEVNFTGESQSLKL